MARYTGPKTRIARKFKEPIFGPDKYLDRRNYPPGQHGLSRKRNKQSEYGIQLQEKQKAKYTYGLLERQFKKLFLKAASKKGITGQNLMKLIESRLDNVVYRLGFAASRTQARQLVRHRHFTVNGKRVDIPSYQIKPGDVIQVKETSKQSPLIKEIAEAVTTKTTPAWLEVQAEEMIGKIVRYPNRDEIDTPIQEHLIVELYSR